MEITLEFFNEPIIKEYCESVNGSDEILSLCRNLFLLVYFGQAKNEKGQMGIFFSDEKIFDFGSSVKIVSGAIAEKLNKETKEVFAQLLVTIKNNYKKTATKKENRSSVSLDRNNSSSLINENLYKSHDFPDWDGFLNRMNFLLE